MDKLQKQIDGIKKQQQDLDTKLQHLLSQRNAALVDMIKSISSIDLDIYMLIGGMLEVIKKSKQPSNSEVEEWRLAGEKFCRRSVPQSQKVNDASKQTQP